MNILIAIIACEVGFWVLLVAGLGARYLLRLRGLSTVLLLCVPLLDVILLSLISWDLVANGTTADFTHGLGAVYLGFTVAFGHPIIRRVDCWFAHRFAGAPEPPKVPKHGPQRVAHEWKEWGRMVICAVLSTAVLGGIVWIVGDPVRTAELIGWIARVWLVAGIWFIGWPVWVTIANMGQVAKRG